ncbi:MAG TPA: prepilin-type N-terminal cleavage/methylation domain-containing protein [Phycisphaerales bacterium]|nr:prepilin-type N-terminal cleavage/methylation domain-containing protein [Phycisphaerales bacterium]
MRNRIKKAFTLVEILIVVVILGILAAIVVPQFTNATQDAQQGNLRAQLKSLQNQIELYKARTNSYPTLAQLNANPTDPDDGTSGWGILIDGDYIKKAPKNPAAPSAVQHVVAAAAGAGAGWHYNEADGTLGATFYDEATDTITPNAP